MGTSGHMVCNLLRESSRAALRKRGLEEKPGEAPPAWMEEAEEEEEEESNCGEGRIPWGQTPGAGPRPEVHNPKWGGKATEHRKSDRLVLKSRPVFTSWVKLGKLFTLLSLISFIYKMKLRSVLALLVCCEN